MNTMELTLSAGTLAMLVIELIKYVYRLAVKNKSADLPALFYALAAPVLSALAPFVLVALGVPTTDPVLTMTWQGVLVYVLRTAVTALVAFVAYNQGLKPAKDYAKLLKAKEVKFQ
jgi:hypothetical protein